MLVRAVLFIGLAAMWLPPGAGQAQSTSPSAAVGDLQAGAPSQPPAANGRHNYSSNRISSRWLADQLASYIQRNQPLPNAQIHAVANPGGESGVLVLVGAGRRE
jgi:hypothetical protein